MNTSKVDIEVHRPLELAVGSKTLRIPQGKRICLYKRYESTSGLFRKNPE